jgi:hypothetical protein
LTTLSTTSDSDSPRPNLFSQFSIKKAVWDTVMDVLVAYSVITSLYFLAFDNPSITALVFDHLVRFMFLLDIAATFNTEITGPRDNII